MLLMLQEVTENGLFNLDVTNIQECCSMLRSSQCTSKVVLLHRGFKGASMGFKGHHVGFMGASWVHIGILGQDNLADAILANKQTKHTPGTSKCSNRVFGAT